LPQPRANPGSTQNPEPLDGLSPKLPTTTPGPEFIPTEDNVPTIQISSPDSTLQTVVDNSNAVGLNTGEKSGGTSGLSLSNKPDGDTNSHTQIDKYSSHTQSLRSYGSSPFKFESRNIFSRLKSIFIGAQLVNDAFLTAYIIKDGEAYKVPHPGAWKLKRKEIKSLHHQSSKKDWFKIFAFLNEYDMAALQEVLAKSGGDGIEGTSSIVHLKKIKESRLKFWASDEALFAIIRDSSFETSSSDSQSQRDIEDIRFESLLELARTQQPKIRPPGETRQPAGISPPVIPLHTNPVAMDAINFAMPQPAPAATPAILSQPPLPPPPIQVFGPPSATPITRNGPPPPPVGSFIPPHNSARIQDLTSPKMMNEVDCLKKLTTYAMFTIRKCIPLDPDTESTWARAEITEERLSQEIIAKQIKKLDDEDTHTVAEKKADLERYQQAQITTLIDSLASREPDRAFEWLLIQLDCIKKPIKNVSETRKRYQLGTTTMSVYVSRTPLRSINPVLLYQNLERARANAMRPPGAPPPPQEAVNISRPKTVTMSNPLDFGASTPATALPMGGGKKKSKKASTFDDSDSDSLGRTSISSVTSRGAFYRERERKREGSLRIPLNRRTVAPTGSTQRPSRRELFSRESRPYTSAGKDVNTGQSSAAFDPIAAAYQAGKADADAERFRERLRARPNRTGYYPAPDSSTRPAVANSAIPNEQYYGRISPRPVISYGKGPTDFLPKFNAAQEYIDRPTGEWDQGRSNLTSQPPQTGDILQRERGPVPYPSHYDSKPYNPQFDDTDAQGIDEDGRDVVQRLLLEWTPSDQEEEQIKRHEPKEEPAPTSTVEETAMPDGSKENDKPEASAPRMQTRKDEERGPVPRGRSPPSWMSISDTKEPSRQATVDDVIDERDNEAGEPSNTVPLTAEQKGKGREEEVEDFAVETILTRSRSEGSPIPLPQPQSLSQRQPSWLDPSYAKNLVDITVPQPSTPNQQPDVPTSNGQDPLFAKAANLPPPRSEAEPRFIPHEFVGHQSWYEPSGNTTYPKAYDTFPERRESDFFTRDHFIPARNPDLEANPWREYERPSQRPESPPPFTRSQYAPKLQASGTRSGYYAEPFTETASNPSNPFAPTQRSERTSSFPRDGYGGISPERRYVERDYITNPQTRARIIGEGPVAPLRGGTSGYESWHSDPRAPLPRRYPDYNDSGW